MRTLFVSSWRLREFANNQNRSQSRGEAFLARSRCAIGLTRQLSSLSKCSDADARAELRVSMGSPVT
jgi:hypothetical protein